MKRIDTDFADEAPDAEINISPLIDIVFILLVFFIITMAFADKNALDIDVPQAAAARSGVSGGSSVLVNADGGIFVDSSPCSLAALPHRIRAAGRGDVVVYADKAARADTLVKVIDAVKEGGAASIYLAAKRKK